jgi:putative ABC transport system ATP-binding protein
VQTKNSHTASEPEKDERAGHLIRTRDLAKVYGSGEARVDALDGVSLDVDSGDWISVIGSSGSGKSTLMNILGMLDRPTSGSYLLEGRDVAGLGGGELARLRRETIGFIFQGYNLLPRQNARQNVEMPMIYENVKPKERVRRATEALGRVGLGDRLEHRPSELSGGQQQRVAIARALINDPSLILADEPTGNLDSVSGESILRLFGELRDSGVTLMVVTHEPDVASYAVRVVELHDGRVISDGSAKPTGSAPAQQAPADANGDYPGNRAVDSSTGNGDR